MYQFDLLTYYVCVLIDVVFASSTVTHLTDSYEMTKPQLIIILDRHTAN